MANNVEYQDILRYETNMETQGIYRPGIGQNEKRNSHDKASHDVVH